MAALVRRGLSEEGAAVDVARTGEDALWMAAAAPYDALVLDVMLPGIDGFETCRRLRDDDVWTPVLLLTARDSVEDRVAGLDGGADDYLTKPFSFAELSARLRALVRRGQKERPAVLEVGELRLDPATRQASRGERGVELSTKEFALLEAFMRRPGEVLSRLELLEHAWDFGYENRSNVIDVYVRYLREKIDRPFGVTSIETVRGAGYRLREDGAHPEPGARAHPAHARLHGRDGRGPDRGGPVRLRASGLGPRGGARQLAALASGRSRGTGGWWAARLVGPGSPRGERREPRSADRTRRQGRLLERWAGRRPGPHERRARARQAGPALREPRPAWPGSTSACACSPRPTDSE